MEYKVKYFNHISDSVYTLEQAKKLVEHLSETFKGCKAHMIEIKELEKEIENELQRNSI